MMKFGWNSIKTSIAGARLSHLVQENSIWDHGSMIEQVRTVFIYLKKAVLRGDPSIVKKCTTTEGFQKICKNIELKHWDILMQAEIVSIEIISVMPSKHNQPDKFEALLKLKKQDVESDTKPDSFYKANRVIEQEWLFLHEGNWWLLHEAKK
jgi:hypothetical protein